MKGSHLAALGLVAVSLVGAYGSCTREGAGGGTGEYSARLNVPPVSGTDVEVIPADDEGAYAPAPVESAVRLPADAAPHKELVEWWYWTGHVAPTDEAEAARSWGFELAIFQQDLVTFGGEGHGYMCHAALTEKHLGDHQHVSRLVLQPDELTHEAPVILDLFPCYAKLDGQGADHYGVRE